MATAQTPPHLRTLIFSSIVVISLGRSLGYCHHIRFQTSAMRAAPLSLALLVLVSCYSSTTGFLLVPKSPSIISPDTSTSLSSKASSPSSKRLPYKIAAAASLSLVTVGLPKVVTAAGGTAPVQEVTKIATGAFSPKEIIKVRQRVSHTRQTSTPRPF